MKKLLIATTNPGKLVELQEFLQDLPIELVSLKDLGISQQAPEDGQTFQENAIKKATFYGELAHFPVLADDGGFEIDVLDGEPGVKSHRWVNHDHENSDEEIIAYTLKRLEKVPTEKRSAQLRLVLALRLTNGQIYTHEERTRGVVADKPAPIKIKGFPYRALLFLPEINKYYDQHYLTPIENEQYNHRKRAVEKLKSVIKRKII